MKLAEMQKKDHKDLLKHASVLREKIATAKRELYTKDNKDVRKIRTLKRELARTLTIAKQKESKEEDKE